MHQNFASAADLYHSFTWDRKDAYGRLTQGWHDIVAQIGFVYDGVYQKTTRFGYNGNGSPIVGSKTRQEVTVQQPWHNQIGGFDLESQGLGGWSLDIQHTYDPAGKVVYLGSGGQQSGQYIGSIVNQSAAGYIPTGMAIGPNNKLYYADRFDNSVWLPHTRNTIHSGPTTRFAWPASMLQRRADLVATTARRPRPI